MDRKWKLGDDLDFGDCILDPVTFEELITTVKCNAKNISQDAVRLALKQIVEIRMQDMKYLLEKNIVELTVEARRRRNT